MRKRLSNAKGQYCHKTTTVTDKVPQQHTQVDKTVFQVFLTNWPWKWGTSVTETTRAVNPNKPFQNWHYSRRFRPHGYSAPN